MTDATGATTYSYDAADRLTSATAPGTGTVGYGYDAAGRRTRLTYPSGYQATYGYDAAGRPATVTDADGRVLTTSYDAAGQVTAITRPNGVDTTFAYDAAGRVTTMNHAQGSTTVLGSSYGYDAVGNRTSMTDGSGATTYGYDQLRRLTSVGYPTGDTVSYGYDAVGNRTSMTLNGVMTTSTFDAANRMTARGSMTYGSDANGNRTSETREDGTTTYSYDERDELTAVREGTGATTSHTVNGDGQRVSSTTGQTTTAYLWDYCFDLTGRQLPCVRPVPAPLLSDGSADYLINARGEVVARRDRSGRVTSVHRDAEGSVRRTTDASGTVTSAVDYDALGARRAQSGQPLILGYRGGVTEPGSRLVVLNGRVYDPDSGYYLTNMRTGGVPLILQSHDEYLYARGAVAPAQGHRIEIGWVPVRGLGGHTALFVAGPEGELVLEGGGDGRLTATYRLRQPSDEQYRDLTTVCGGDQPPCPDDTHFRLIIACSFVMWQRVDWNFFPGGSTSNTVVSSTIEGLGIQPLPDAEQYFSASPGPFGFAGWDQRIPAPAPPAPGEPPSPPPDVCDPARPS